MAIELPASPKVYTTKYTNFKGVDFTNDPTNVWYRRSPDAVNMLPDASGRPFKRHGWDLLITNEDLCTALGVDACEIYKCSYFELAGVDHIVVFTDNGVLFYNGDENATSYNGVAGITYVEKDYDCYMGFDRCFFFEGGGTSAFYIYGNFKVWRYESDFVLHDVTDQITVPTVIFSADAEGTGEMLYGSNLLGTKVAIEYNSVELYTFWSSDGIEIAVDPTLKSDLTIGDYCVWEYDADATPPSWDKVNGNINWSSVSSKITISGTPQDKDQIAVLYTNGVLLPNNVSQSQLDQIEVRASQSIQFDYKMIVGDSDDTLSHGVCRLVSDETKHREKGRAWIEFYSNDVATLLTPLASGEDCVKVSFPYVKVEISNIGIGDTLVESTATLVGL